MQPSDHNPPGRVHAVDVAHDPIGDVEEKTGEQLPEDHDPWGEAGDSPTVEEEPDGSAVLPGA